MATYDIDALKNDLPTAKDLAQFVYDKVGVSLDLIGKPKEDQYAVAKNALEGKKIPSEFITDTNPYLDKKELIPVDEQKKMPPRSDKLPDLNAQVNIFVATNMPHPLDPQSDRKVQIKFRKFDNGVITYEVTGPIEQQAVGERINKFGQRVPERYTWIDPRTPETILRNQDGTYSDKGRGLYAYCVGEKGAGIWPLIDKDVMEIAQKNIANPWA
jgi:hypothetical protein